MSASCSASGTATGSMSAARASSQQSALSTPFELGDQKILLVRDDTGRLQGFHNTCRHRGAELCRESSGPLRTGAIVCPYHAWVYNLQGDLLRTSSKSTSAGLRCRRLSALWGQSARVERLRVRRAWRAIRRRSSGMFDLPLNRLDAWPLEDLVVGHVLSKTIESNWKIFWENYNECLHCPGVHPKLSSLVPIFGRGLLEERDDPEWSRHAADPDPEVQGRSARGRGDLVDRRAGRGRAVLRVDRGGSQDGPHLYDRLAVDVHRRPCRLRACGALAAARTGADRAARRVSVLAAKPWPIPHSTCARSSISPIR